MKTRLPVSIRFWSYVVKSESGCWTWTGSIDREGYGRLGVCGHVVSAHRLSWGFAHGGRSVPDGKSVLHRCDNRRCVNPEHLFLGTQKENMADAANKGRMAKARGEQSPSAKITDSQVMQMRLLRSSGWLLRQLAEQFGIGTSQVHRILAGGSR